MKPLSSNPIHGESSFLSLASASPPNRPLTTDEAIEVMGQRVLTLAQTGRCAIFLRQRDGSAYTCPWSIGLSAGYIQKLLAETSHSSGKDHFFLSHPRPLIISDTRKAQIPSALSLLSRQEGYRSVHVWPVKSKGTIIAVILCYFNKVHTLTKSEYRAMISFATQAGFTLEDPSPLNEQRPTTVLNGLYDLSRQLVINDTIETQLDRFVRSTVEMVQVSFCRVLTREGDGAFICRAAYPPRITGYKNQAEPQQAQLVYQRIASSEEPFLLRRTDITLTYDSRVALELDSAHTLCLVPLKVDTEIVGMLVLGEERSHEAFHIERVRLASMIADLVATVIHRERLYHRLEESYLETILALTRTLEARDPYTAGHSMKLVEMVEKTGKRLGCPPTRLQAMRWASLLHDIGKIGVPDEILRRPGPLSKEEWEIMKQHPHIGAEIITPITSLALVAPFILAHHEQYDGNGYPNGLRGEGIPLEARVLSVVDAYCAMTDGRVYRPAKTHVEAVTELKKCSGKHFDPMVVDAFLSIFEKE
jgi:HD-GYP domain-containing protein (c-di-GMP phosphodiesterase class II)